MFNHVKYVFNGVNVMFGRVKKTMPIQSEILITTYM